METDEVRFQVPSVNETYSQSFKDMLVVSYKRWNTVSNLI
jgi:hypothetical protein